MLSTPAAVAVGLAAGAGGEAAAFHVFGAWVPALLLTAWRG
ncbi:hypothetical protein [Streptomyces sp. RK9]